MFGNGRREGSSRQPIVAGWARLKPGAQPTKSLGDWIGADAAPRKDDQPRRGFVCLAPDRNPRPPRHVPPLTLRSPIVVDRNGTVDLPSGESMNRVWIFVSVGRRH